jgi:hypothetical protein
VIGDEVQVIDILEMLEQNPKAAPLDRMLLDMRLPSTGPIAHTPVVVTTSSRSPHNSSTKPSTL